MKIHDFYTRDIDNDFMETSDDILLMCVAINNLVEGLWKSR